MELFLFSTALVGLATIIAAFDEWFDWMGSYHRAAAEQKQEDMDR